MNDLDVGIIGLKSLLDAVDPRCQLRPAMRVLHGIQQLLPN
jgi:hypothetical protein